MSFAGWLEYGDRGPIIGRWPEAKVIAPRTLGPGDRVVIENGMIRQAAGLEYGPKLPEGAQIIGTNLEVPAWWWYLHFGELLREEDLRRCCHEAGHSRDQCADCPEIYQAMERPCEFAPPDAEPLEPTFTRAPMRVTSFEQKGDGWKLEAEAVNSVAPCWRGSLCSWPACKIDCDGRPGKGLHHVRR